MVEAEIKDCVTAFILAWIAFIVFNLMLRMFYMLSLVIGFSCFQNITSTLAGISSIILSNYFASLCFVYLCEYWEVGMFKNTAAIATNWGMLLCTTLIILLVFLYSGGVPAQLFLSHVACPGAFAREYVTVDNKGLTPSPSMKHRVQEIGAQYGCHHCGKFSDQYISDHMPPTVMYLNKEVPQRLYPQCRGCSLFQGGTLSSRSTFSYFSRRGTVSYPWRLKRWLFWMPYYLLIEFLFDASGNLLRAKHAEQSGMCNIFTLIWNN